MKSLTPLLYIGIGLVLGIVLLRGCSANNFWKPATTEIQSVVLLEQIKKVAKLITVEGEMSDIYDHRNYYGLDLPVFQKKALLKVQAKVSVGYDLEKMNIHLDENTKTLYLSPLPPPEILSIDPTIQYYDLTEGYFNSFTAQELTQITQAAKDDIRKKAANSHLFKAAEQQAQEALDLIKSFAEAQGWQVVQNEGKGIFLPSS
ncbi:MAG: DUF4230 domain-containing protein [Sphingobacteriales bacterium]|nr:DUF4230 domain-containing protein [Sphingobacteriales bacterium]